MPVSEVQPPAFGAGGASSATVAVSLTGPAAAGSSVVIGYWTSAPVASYPPGFGLDFSDGTGPVIYWWRLDTTAGGEQSWNVGHSLSGIPGLWGVWELSGVDTVAPVDATAVTASFHPATTASTLSTGTTGNTGTVDTLNLALHAFYNGSFGGSTGSWAGHTNGFLEEGERSLSFGTAPNVTFAAVSFADLAAPSAAGPFECTATLTTDETRSSANDTFHAALVSYRAVGQVVVPAGRIVVA